MTINQYDLKDTGKRREFDTGAHRDDTVGKGRFDLIPTQLLFRLARHYEMGARKYGPGNWTNGMPISTYLDSALRHLIKYQDGWNDEDHLAAAVWNLAAIMHHEQKLPDLMDLPERINDQIQKWSMFKPDDEEPDENATPVQGCSS